MRCAPDTYSDSGESDRSRSPVRSKSPEESPEEYLGEQASCRVKMYVLTI